MSDVAWFECASKDGTDLKVFRRRAGGGVWLDAASPIGPFVMVLLTNDDASALGQRLIELAGGAAPATGATALTTERLDELDAMARGVLATTQDIEDANVLAVALLEATAEVRRLHVEVWRLREEATRPAPRTAEEQEAMDIIRRAAEPLRANDDLRAEVERLRAVDAEWQRVTGYSAPERFPGLTEEQRAAGVERAREWLANLPPSLAKMYADLKRIDAEERAKKEARLLSELRRIHHADQQPEPADITERFRARWARLSEAAERGAGPFERGYLRGLCDAYRCAEVDTAGHIFDAEQRPDVSPDAVANVAARFDAADPKWHRLYAEVKRRYPASEQRASRHVYKLGSDIPVRIEQSPTVESERPESTSPAAAQDGSSVAQAEEAPPDDGRWQPGAVWEHRCLNVVRRMEVAQAEGPTAPGVAMMRVQGTWSALQSVHKVDMTEANGWRFIGRPAEEPR